MGWLEALVLGLVQGLTEFLPISSSAHLSIVGQLFGGDDPGSAFTAISQLGTETAVLIYFRKDIARIVRAWRCSMAGLAAVWRYEAAFRQEIAASAFLLPLAFWLAPSRGLALFLVAALVPIFVVELLNSAIATTQATITAITPRMPMPFTNAPTIPLATQIANTAISTLRMRSFRFERLIRLDPSPIDGVRRCRPPSWLSRTSDLPCVNRRSLSRVRSATSVTPRSAGSTH